jgi:hypothetical protein
MTHPEIVSSTNKSKLSLIINYLAKYLQDLVTFKSILIALIGSNLIFISFTFGNQLRIMFCFDHIDQGNLVSTIIWGFIIIFFTFIIFLYEDIFT